MKNKTLKQKLKNREVSIGSWITIGHQAIIDILAEAGFEWLCVDLEHTVIDYNELQVLIGFIQAHNIAALVRVNKNEEVVIKRAFDAGADGIIVPMTSSGEDAKKAVEYSKYPPVGKRGVGLNRAQRYGFGFEEYKKWLTDNQVVIAQVEHIDGVNNIEDIINTQGIDGVFIGPYDLSASMGMPGHYNDPAVVEALKKLEGACLDNKVTMGYHVIEPDYNLLKDKIKLGYNFLAFSADFLFMGKTAANEMDKFKNNNQ